MKLLVTSPFQPIPSCSNHEGLAPLSRWLTSILPIANVAYALAGETRRVRGSWLMVGMALHGQGRN